MNSSNRQSTGIPSLDEHLGGGLIPGTLTVVVGATGIGKTQLGVQYAHAGRSQEGRSGVLFDVSARGDSQSHREYASRLFDWTLSATSAGTRPDLTNFFDADREFADYLHVFDYSGRRVTRQDLDWDQWRDWQAELNAKLQHVIAFLYGNFTRGCRRMVVDGVEPADRPNDSIQLNLFEYVYHQVLRKESEWVARDLFRQDYRKQAELAQKHAYDAEHVGCLMLYTSREAVLDDLIVRPLDEGDALSNANTLIYMGKVRDGDRIGRGLYIAKHRGSACSDSVLRYRIETDGIHIEE